MNTLIKTFGAQKRWVNWNMDTRGEKPTKVPIGSSTDPKTWSTYADLPNKERIGLMFGLKKMLLGIDIDHCLKDGEIISDNKDVIWDLLKVADTYTEVSPSGTGLHLFLQLEEPLDLISNKKASLGYECYTTGRYFTVTQQPFGEEKPVRKVSVAEANEILSIIGYPWKTNKTTPQPISSSASNGLDDDMVLQKMFGASNGDKVKALFDGDTSGYAGDESSADMALCAHLSFYTGGNQEQIERIWMGSPLGSRSKTQERKDYRDKTIQNAIAGTKEFYKPSPKVKSVQMVKALDLDLLYTLSKNGDKIYTQNTENICRILRKHPNFQGILRYDAFTMTTEIKRNGKWQEIEDVDTIHIQTEISILFSFFQKVGKDMVYDAIVKVSKESQIDSAINYVTSLRWDGIYRLDTWLTNVYGVENTPYHTAVGSNWMKGLVKRIVEPGCKFDHVLVLEGEQGTKKSTSLAILGGDWHVETTMSTDTKDFFMQFVGNIIVEFSEGETLSRSEVKKLKAIITTQYDKFRLPYQRTIRSFPRRCVFAMTTNQEEYLKDETGNRRWLPVKLVLPNANIAWLKEFRDQLFAEAYHRVVNLHETVYEFPEDATKEQQAQRKIQDPNAEAIAQWYFNALDDTQRKAGITVHQVFQDALENRGSIKMNQWDSSSIGNVLRDHLGLKKVQNMRHGVRAVRWYQNVEDADLDVQPYVKYPQQLVDLTKKAEF